MSSSLEFASIPESTLRVWISEDTTSAIDNIKKEAQTQLEREDPLCTVVDSPKCHDEEDSKKPVEDQASANKITMIGGNIDVSQSVTTALSDEREKLTFSSAAKWVLI